MQPTTVDNTLIGIVLAIIAVIAVLAIAVMLVGSRNKRARRDGPSASGWGTPQCSSGARLP